MTGRGVDVFPWTFVLGGLGFDVFCFCFCLHGHAPRMLVIADAHMHMLFFAWIFPSPQVLWVANNLMVWRRGVDSSGCNN
jgi:hypothetical protein